MSWKPEEGLSLFVDRQRVGYQPTAAYRRPDPALSMNMYVGRDGSRTNRYPAATVDDLEMFYADRYGGGGRGRLYTYHYTVTTRMT